MRTPPRLVARTLVASFLTVALILGAVFALISFDVRQRVRQSAEDNLEAGQQLFALVESRRHQDLVATISTLAENPTLKAALDIWQTERGAGAQDSVELVATVKREADSWLHVLGPTCSPCSMSVGTCSPAPVREPRPGRPAPFCGHPRSPPRSATTSSPI